jgi:hypothetical protein
LYELFIFPVHATWPAILILNLMTLSHTFFASTIFLWFSATWKEGPLFLLGRSPQGSVGATLHFLHNFVIIPKLSSMNGSLHWTKEMEVLMESDPGCVVDGATKSYPLHYETQF